MVGPLAGAWIAQGSDWRWIFWGSTIVGAAVQTAGIFLLDESVSDIVSWSTIHADLLIAYAPVLLERKAVRLRKEYRHTEKTETIPEFKTAYSETNNK